MEMIIDTEFKSYMPEQSEDEHSRLESLLVKDGCCEPLVTWNGILIDGHNRYEICTRLGIDFETREKQFNNRNDVLEWIIDYQLSRRNMIPYNMTKYALKKSDLIAARAKENQVRKPADSVLPTLAEQKQTINTREEVAKIAGVSHGTVDKVKAIESAASDEQKADLSAGKKSINKVFNEIKPKPATPPQIITPEPEPQAEMVTIPKHEYEELHSVLEEYKAESEATEAVFDADDKVAAAVAEIYKLTAKITLLETQKTGLLNQCNELKRSSINKDRQIAKLQRELNQYKLEEVEK